VVVLFVLMGAFCCAGTAQDKIVTANGDTILCRILDVSTGKISYEQTLSDGRVVGKFISSDHVSEYSRTSQLLLEQTTKERRRSFFSTPPKPFRISVEGGYGHLLSSFSDIRNGMTYVTSENKDRYFRRMKNGIHLGADFHLLLNDHFGVGAKYSFFFSETELDELIPAPSVVPLYYAVNQKERFYLNYAAPSLLFRQWLDKNRRLALNESLSLGYVFFRSETRTDIYTTGDANYLLENRRFAGSLDVSLEYGLLSNLSVSVNVGAFYTQIKNPEISYVDLNNNIQTQTSESGQSIDMSRLNLSAGLHFYF
jgi:hypothetical protein